MSSVLSPKPLTLSVNSSRTLRWFSICLHGVAVIAAFSLPLLWQVPALLLILASAWMAYRKKASFRLEYTNELWRLDGEPVDCVATKVWPWLVSLTFANGPLRRTSVVVAADSVSDTELRRLKVIARHCKLGRV